MFSLVGGAIVPNAPPQLCHCYALSVQYYWEQMQISLKDKEVSYKLE